MRTVFVPALTRTRVAGSFAKRMPLKLQLAAEPLTEGDPVSGVVEVERAPLAFLAKRREELILRPKMEIAVSYWDAYYTVHVTSERPLNVHVASPWPPMLRIAFLVSLALTSLAVALALLFSNNGP